MEQSNRRKKTVGDMTDLVINVDEADDVPVRAFKMN